MNDTSIPTADIVTAPESAPGIGVALVGAQGLNEFVRYVFASFLALAADTGTLYILTSIVGVSYLWSGAIAFLLGLAIVYVLSIAWVFEKRQIHNPLLEFLIFAVIGIIGLGINEAVLWTLTGLLGLYYLISKIASVVIVFTWNFFARRYMLFAHE